MAKSKVDIAKLTLGSAVPVVKVSPEEAQVESNVEELVKNIHEPETPQSPAASNPPLPTEQPQPGQEEAKRMGRPPTRIDATVRISVDMPKPLFKHVKKKLVDMEITMIEYINQLIQKDMEG